MTPQHLAVRYPAFQPVAALSSYRQERSGAFEVSCRRVSPSCNLGFSFDLNSSFHFK